MTSADDIADGIVAMLNTLATDISFVAVNPPQIPEIEREVDAATVQVYPYEESEESKTHTDDMVQAVRVVKVIVQCPMGTLTRAQCLTWLNQLKEGFRNTTVDGFKWDKCETETLYDFPAIKTKNQFLSLFSATYYNFA